MTEREMQVHAFAVNVQSIKMKVKFPCRMKLEYSGETLTGEVPQNEAGKFIFNQYVTLREDPEKSSFEITAHLCTDKGSKYIAGVVKLTKADLINQEGEMLLVHLVRCLDAEATCELRVDQVTCERVMRKGGFDNLDPARNGSGLHRSVRKNDFQNEFSPIKNARGTEGPINHHGTKSEYQFPLASGRAFGQWEDRSKNGGQISYLNKNRSIANFHKNLAAGSVVARNLPEFGGEATSRDRQIEAEVYKENYQKLKEKCKKEADNAKHELNKRLALENNENNFKLEIMRLKLRCEQQQKSLQDKNNRIKEFQIQLAILQKKELDLEYLREESANKDHSLKMLEETIRTLSRDNEELKGLNRDRFDSEQDKTRELRAEIEASKAKYEKKIGELERQLRSKAEAILQKDGEIRLKEERILREQRLVQELERSAQAKVLEFQKSLNNEKNESKSKYEELKEKHEKLEKEKSKIEAELSDSKTEQEKTKSYIIKAEYDKKLLGQELDSARAELLELKVIKEKYYEQTRENKILTDEKNHLQKQYEKTLQSRDINLSDLTRQSQEQIEHYKKIYREAEERIRVSQTKLLETEALLEQRKNECEKMKRNSESASREVTELREREKSLKRNLKSKEDQCINLQQESEALKQRSKNTDQMQRYEMDGLREELGRLKREMEGQTVRGLQFQDKNTGLVNELNQLRLKVQYSEDQAEKNAAIYREKLADKQNTIGKLERVLAEQKDKLQEFDRTEKEKNARIQKLEVDILHSSEGIDQLAKELKMQAEKQQQREQLLKNKQTEISALQQEKQELWKKVQQLENVLTETKNELNHAKGENTKNEKIMDILNREISDLKHESEAKTREIAEAEKRENNIRNEVKAGKEENLKAQMKGTGVKKDYERFKEQLLETLISTFSQLPGLLATSSYESAGKRSRESAEDGIAPNDLLNIVNNQHKTVKASLSKLLEQNRTLERELEKSRDDFIKNNNHGNEAQAKLVKQIEVLEADLSKSIEERERVRNNLSAEIAQLEGELSDKDLENKELVLQIEELNFSLNSLGMDLEAKAEHYDMKSSQFKSKISELEEKIAFQLKELENSDSKIHEAEAKIASLEKKLSNETGSKEKKEKESDQLAEELRKLNEINEEGKKNRKELLEKVTELEMKLNTELELREKCDQLIRDEEHKNGEMKEFVANLMKQKENAIKSELAKSEQIIVMEGKLIEVTRERDMLTEEAQRLMNIIDEQKEMIRKLNMQIKDMELSANEEKNKSAKLTQKLKDIEVQYTQLKETHKHDREEHQAKLTKTQKEISALQMELENLARNRNKLEGELKEKSNEYSQEQEELQREIGKLKSENIILEENIFTEKQNVEAKAAEVIALEESLSRLRVEKNNLAQVNHNLAEELREKEEGMFELAGKIYYLENQLEAKEREKNEQIEVAAEDWSNKYENACSEYEQRLQMTEKEKSYFKGRLDEMEAELRKVMAEVKNSEADEGKLKKALTDKVKKLEEDRLSILSSKNTEIQKLAQQNKLNFDNLKAKQSEIRRLQQEVEIARATIAKLDTSKRETEEKIKNINKVYQEEIDGLKKREIANRSNRDNISQIHWDMEREMKRIIQAYSKKLISSKDSPQKVLGEVKNMENEILGALSSKMGGNASTVIAK